MACPNEMPAACLQWKGPVEIIAVHLASVAGSLPPWTQIGASCTVENVGPALTGVAGSLGAVDATSDDGVRAVEGDNDAEHLIRANAAARLFTVDAVIARVRVRASLAF